MGSVGTDLRVDLTWLWVVTYTVWNCTFVYGTSAPGDPQRVRRDPGDRTGRPDGLSLRGAPRGEPMPRPYRVIERVQTPEGLLELLQKGEDDFVISIGGRVLMSSGITRSEIAVAEHGVAPIRDRPSPRVLIGGLGLGYTLRAALDALPSTAQVEVAELNPIVVDWCRGPAVACHGDALSDPRVRVVTGDVADRVRDASAGRTAPYDAIIVDLYVGPTGADGGERDPLYGAAILRATLAALTPGGRYAVWGEKRHRPFEERLRRVGFSVTFRDEHGGGPRHAVYLADRPVHRR